MGATERSVPLEAVVGQDKLNGGIMAKMKLKPIEDRCPYAASVLAEFDRQNETAYMDLVRLAEKNGGKIPLCIPAHYVKYVQAAHREAHGMVRNEIGYDKNRDGIIVLTPNSILDRNAHGKK